MPELQAVLAAHRKIVVLLADEKTQAEAERQHAVTVGQALFHDKLAQQARVAERLASSGSMGPARLASLAEALDYIESGAGLFDADRLAFREVLVAMRAALAADGSLPAVKLHKRVADDLDALAEIERQYDREITQIFSRFETRAIALKREKWDDYVAHLKQLYAREQVLKDHGLIVPYTPSQLPAPPKDGGRPAADTGKGEVFGHQLPAKTVALTFDDGPHGQYTEEIVAILKQYGVPATFFQVGRNLGTVDDKNQPRLGRNAEITRRLIAGDYAVGNHSYSHAQLSRESGAALKAEIGRTETLLQAIDAKRAPVFRFPYGARNAEGLQALDEAHLRSIMWNIDSLDWADPVPRSIADRVLASVEKQGRGIILFHDIHERSARALPLVLDRLVAEGWQFAGWDGSSYSVRSPANAAGANAAAATDAGAKVTTGYASSWAVVIGINDYAKWPKLQYAVNDASAVRQALVERFGFDAQRVLMLKDGEATRSRILSTFNEQLGGNRLGRNDRVFVFFSGHGATRKLSSGREVGYIIPADADPNDTATDAVPMTEIQNIAESLGAKHVFFVMDACYSGLGLTRGAGRGGGFLRDNARRTGRQMLTAGGADQLVADGGPNGHSVFTWTLLQGLAGRGDLNGDGLITATELAAYVAPAVASVSQQTPAFGSLPGSEGGDFVFELPAETEYLSAGSTQLGNDAIALNSKLEAARPAASAPAPGRIAEQVPVKVRDLQGGEQTIQPPSALATTAAPVRLLAQRANDRGLQFFKEKRYAEAEAQFTEALKLRPDFALAANNLGFVYFKQDRFAEAARWFENTLKLDPSRAVAYLNLGDAQAKAGDAKSAEKAYRTYLELAPQGPGAAHVRKQLGMS